MTERPAPCYREATNGVHFTRNAHQHGCEDPLCRGCVTCPGRHCTARKSCTWHVDEADITCGRCLGAARLDLRWIGDLSGLLLTQAIADGVTSEAAALAGPATDPRAWAGIRLAQSRHLTTWMLADRITEQQATNAMANLEEDDKRHAERLVTTWTRMVAEDYQHPLPERMTLAWCVGYLDRMLHRIAQDPEQDFPLLRRELKKCREHLEAVLHNDEQRDRGAPCPECVRAQAAVRADLEERKVPRDEWPRLRAPRLVRQYARAVGHDRYDQWQCPTDTEHAWSHHAYVAYVEDRRRGTRTHATRENA